MNTPTNDPFKERADDYAHERANHVLARLNLYPECESVAREHLLSLELERAYLQGALLGLQTATKAIKENLT